MAIWDAVGTGLDFGEKTKKSHITNTAFTNIIGDSITTLMGGGRFTDLIGSDAKVVVDYEMLLEHGLKKLGPILLGAAFGIGGDTGFNFGNKTTFQYGGEVLPVHRGENTFTFMDSTNGNNPKRKAIYVAGVVGVAAIITTGLLIKCQYNNFSTAGKEALAKEIISTIYPMVETRWLYLMKHLEKSFSIMVTALRENIKKAEAQLDKDEKEVALAKCEFSNLKNLIGESDAAAQDIALKKLCDAVTYRNWSRDAFEITNKRNTADLARMGAPT
jgi:hypothetical protein